MGCLDPMDADGSETEVQYVTETSNEEDFQIAATENQEMNVSKVEQDDITENTEDFLKMIHALRSDLQSKENIDEKWLESLQAMERHYIQENQARKEKSTKLNSNLSLKPQMTKISKSQ